ncbi:MAG TPA: 16S rRNA (cytidine(1402)-2'-O)-methyltransferase [Halomicronema sp.]
MNQNPLKTHTLYIVGTPIGNLEDMTFRAVRILQNVDLIAAEDTRHTGKLLQHFQITTPQISYHEHNRHERIPELLEILQKGKTIALVTDAGMPAISDPGYELVKACIEAELNVIPIPGSTAAITALCASGLAADRFIFEGFLPTKTKDRQTRLQVLKTESRTIILYEAPHRLQQTLQDLTTVLEPTRQIVLARELTKIYEEFWRGTIAQALTYYETETNPKGEYTVVISGLPEQDLILSEDTIKLELQTLLNQGMSRSQASKYLSEQINLPKRQIYQLALTL